MEMEKDSREDWMFPSSSSCLGFSLKSVQIVSHSAVSTAKRIVQFGGVNSASSEQAFAATVRPS